MAIGPRRTAVVISVTRRPNNRSCVITGSVTYDPRGAMIASSQQCPIHEGSLPIVIFQTSRKRVKLTGTVFLAKP